MSVLYRLCACAVPQVYLGFVRIRTADCCHSVNIDVIDSHHSHLPTSPRQDSTTARQCVGLTRPRWALAVGSLRRRRRHVPATRNG